MSQCDTNMLPAARLEDLVTTESGDELLVYDTKTHVIHHLNPTATTIWRLLDGQQTLDSVERSASAILGVDVSREVVESALTSLDGLDLLDGHVAFDGKSANPSRRRFLKKAAAAGVAIPVIASITAPAAYAGISDCPLECGRLTVNQACWTGGPSGGANGVCGTCKQTGTVQNPNYTCSN